jgi:hypothetical protein
MFEYNTQHATALREYFLDAHRDGDLIEFAGIEFATTATFHDGTNVIRAILVIADSMESDEFERMFEDLAVWANGNVARVFATLIEEFHAVGAGTEFAEFEDGSVAVIPATANAVTVTELVTTRHADGTITRDVQTVADAHAVIADGHARLIALAENGEIETDFEDVHEFETLTETE